MGIKDRHGNTDRTVGGGKTVGQIYECLNKGGKLSGLAFGRFQGCRVWKTSKKRESRIVKGTERDVHK